MPQHGYSYEDLVAIQKIVRDTARDSLASYYACSTADYGKPVDDFAAASPWTGVRAGMAPCCGAVARSSTELIEAHQLVPGGGRQPSVHSATRCERASEQFPVPRKRWTLDGERGRKVRGGYRERQGEWAFPTSQARIGDSRGTAP